MSTLPVRLVRFVFYVACEPNPDEGASSLEDIGDGIADHLRDHRSLQALTVASDVDEVEMPIDFDPDEVGDELIDALTAQWPELDGEERHMLDEAIDSHVYWQLSDQHYRNDGYVQEPGSDDDENAEAITKFNTLAAKLAAPKETKVAVGGEDKS